MEHRIRLKHTDASYMAHKEEEGEVSESVPSKVTFPHDSNSYRIIDEIGNGMRAVFYKVECIPMNSTLVAIKSIDLDQSRADFENARRKSKMLTLLSHPNVFRAHCSFIVDRRLWVVMPFMSSGSLQSIVASSFPDGLTEPCIAIVLRETLKALCYLHGQGHLPRDIKAGNILIDSDGSIKLADFGVSASIYESNLTHGSISISPVNKMVSSSNHLILDEADSMFDRGFGPDILKFLGPLKNRASNALDVGFQTVLVTATMKKGVQKLDDGEFQGIEHLRTSSLHKRIASARHDFIKLTGAENKLEALLQDRPRQESFVLKKSLGFFIDRPRQGELRFKEVFGFFHYKERTRQGELCFKEVALMSGTLSLYL